jgi:hypothetical protein
MGPILLRRLLERHRGRLAALAAVLACATAIAVHHAGPMDGKHGGMGMSASAQLCLAAFTAVGAAVVVVALGVIGLGRWRPPLRLAPSAAWLGAPPLPRARAGPALLLLVCVSRR